MTATLQERPMLTSAPATLPNAATDVAPVVARLVLVDDDNALRLALHDLLVDAGYRVVGEAGNGVDGLAVIVQSRPDVVLLDLRMPGLGGVQVARELRQRCPDVRSSCCRPTPTWDCRASWPTSA